MLERLSELQFEIEHIPGKLNALADALSRNSYTEPARRPVRSLLSTLTLRVISAKMSRVGDRLREEIAQAQEEDLFCRAILQG